MYNEINHYYETFQYIHSTFFSKVGEKIKNISFLHK